MPSPITKEATGEHQGCCFTVCVMSWPFIPDFSLWELWLSISRMGLSYLPELLRAGKGVCLARGTASAHGVRETSEVALLLGVYRPVILTL